MIKRCARCGKQINVRQSNYKNCAECRPIAKRERNAAYFALWGKRNREKHLKHAREAMRKDRRNQKLKLIREILSAKEIRHENYRTVR